MILPINVGTESLTSRALFSLLSWRYLFSVRRAEIEGLERFLAYPRRLGNLQGKNWEDIEPIIQQADHDYEDYSRRFEVMNALIYQNLLSSYRQDYSHRLALQVLAGGLLLQEAKIKKGDFPEKMEEFLASDSGVVDLPDRKTLHFRFSQDGKTLRLYSVGLNLRDDGGEGFPVGAWTSNQSKDDIWIEVP